MLDLTLNNTYRLSTYASSPASKRSGHKKFLYDLIEQLFKRGGRPTRGSDKREKTQDITVGEISAHKSVKLFAESRACAACSEAGRKPHKSRPSRTPLSHVSGNSRPSHGTQRPPRTSFGCNLCRLPLCRPEVHAECWEEHLRRHQTATSEDTKSSSQIM